MTLIPHETASTPATWDRLISTSNHPTELVSAIADAPQDLRLRRKVRIAMTTRCKKTINEALDELDRTQDSGAHGLRLLANITLGQYTSILQASERPLTSLDPHAVEDAADGAFARGMALSETRRFTESLAQLHLARTLAQALDMQHRVQHVELEIGRLHTNMGQPDPQLLINAISRAPLSDRRRLWALGLLAESHVALGDYETAATLLARGDQKFSEVQAFTLALLGRHHEAADQLEPRDTYGQVARALWALRLGSPFHAPLSKGASPQSEYGSIVRAWGMLQARPMAAQARTMLLGLTVRTPDQRAHRAAALVRANQLGGFGDDIDDLVAEFNAALNAMTVRGPFLTLLRSLAPETFALLAMLPEMHQEVAESLPEVPLLIGGELSFRYQQHRLPGRSNGSSVMVLAAATGRTGPESRPHPQAAQRIRSILVEMGARDYVNLGGLLRVIKRFSEQARFSRKEAWAAALNRAFAWVDSGALRQEIRDAMGL